MATYDTTLPFSSVRSEATLQKFNEGKRAANDLRSNYFGRSRFQNLNLGVARNGNPLSRVTLFSADEIIMHDGFRVPNWLNVTADIAASGAGGLDTGAEAASTWYEIYAIQKSSDDTKALMLHKARSFTIDEQQSTDAGASSTLTAATNRLSQGFQVDIVSSPFCYVDVYMGISGAPTGGVYLEIQTNSGGFPSGTVVATSDVIDVTRISTTSTWLRFHFRTQPTLSAGTQYHLVMNPSGATLTGVNLLSWSRSTTDVYATRGGAASYNGTVWSTIATSDFTFQLVAAVDTALVLPTGYDRYARIGFVFNNSSNNFNPFWQHNNEVTIPIVQVATGLANLYPALVTALNLHFPPVPLIGCFYISHTSSGSVVGISSTDSPSPSRSVGLQSAMVPVSNNNEPQTMLEVMMEDQAVYAHVSVATGGLWVRAYRW